MKYLSDYTEQTETLNKYGAFFAFSTSQFDEQKKEGVVYVSCGAGLIAPKPNVEALMSALDDNHTAGIKKDIEENGLVAIIQRELSNHEAQITYSTEDTKEALAGYGVTEQQLNDGFSKFIKYCDEHDLY